MTRILATVVLFFAVAAAAHAEWGGRSVATQPHPAVVRVVATDSDGMSCGSGSLVAVNDIFGMVVTNWHVIRDAVGPITVFFPDGFRSQAFVLRTDRDWDLAALAVWRPRVTPIAISNETPRPGDMLTIAGYGSGDYLARSGRCTQYVAPSGNFPAEMVELDAPARQGDSGGPIFNVRGELAGVLFGTAFGRTTGSYCGRLRCFLNSADVDFVRLSERTLAARQSQQAQTTAAVAAAPPATPPSALVPIAPAVAADRTPQPVAEKTPAPTLAERTSPPSAGASDRELAVAPSPFARSKPHTTGREREDVQPEAARSDHATAAPTAAIPSAGASPAAPVSAADQIKTILAAVGILALLYHAVRLLGRAVG